MKEQLIYFIGTLIVVDITVIVAGVVPHLCGVKIGYRWRKILWLVLAVRLLMPVRFVMGRIYVEKPSYFVQIEIPLSYMTKNIQSDTGSKDTAGGDDTETESAVGRDVTVPDDAETEVAGKIQTAVPDNTETGIAGKMQAADIEKTEKEKSDIENKNIRKSNIEKKDVGNTEIENKNIGKPDIEETDKTLPASNTEHSINGNSADTSIYAGILNKIFESLYKDKWLLLAIWLLVGLALTDYHVIGFLQIKELIGIHSHQCEDSYLCSLVGEICREYHIKSAPQIRICKDLNSPMILGYRHTQLLMPDRPYTETDISMIVRHELQHKKNGDLWYKLVIMFVCDIYWFNPVLLLMRKLAYQDVECVCDAQVLRRLPAGERKVYGNIVLSHMVKSSGRDIVYGTSIFTGKRAAKLRIRNMFTEKNKGGYIVLGTLILCVTAGSSMWVFPKQAEAASENTQLGITETENGQLPDDESSQNLVTFRVGDLDTIRMNDKFELADYYITNKVTVSNRYYIDEDNVLWGYGKSEYGQLGIKDFSMESFYREPVKIAEDVVTVDCSVNGYFCVYLTKDGSLYGLGSNMLGLLGVELNGGIWYNATVTEPALLMENVAYVRAGMENIAALDRDGNVWWWGQYCGTYHTRDCDYRDYWNAVEDDRNPAKMLYNDPKKILENCIYVTTGDTSGAAISADGGLYTWGRNILGECGTPVTGDDFVRTPKRVLDNVRMVWVGKIAFGSPEQEIPTIGRYDTTYDFNLFAQLEDGTVLGVGKGLGDQEKVIAVTGDLVETSMNVYSDTFVPIALEEYSEPAVRQLLNGLAWGISKVEVREFLTRNGFQYMETFDDGYSIAVEDCRYYLYFDEGGHFDQIFLQEGGSRSQKFVMGMSMEEVRAYFDSGLTYEDGVYWSNEILDGSYFGFVFQEDALEIVYEKAP